MYVKKLCAVAMTATALCLTYNAAAAVSYNWNGHGDATSWGQPANWVQNAVPIPSINTLDIAIGTGFPTISTLPINIGVTDVVRCTDQLFGPEWGQTLNIYGAISNGFGFAPVGAVGGPQTHVNMYGTASIVSGDTVFVGDMFWFAGGPNVVVNLFDTSSITGKYVALGGHINLYGTGSVSMTTFPLFGPPTAGWWQGISTDATRRVNIVNGSMSFPTGNTAAIQGWVARNIFMAYGKAGSSTDLIITDNGTSTVVTTVPLGGALQSEFIPPLNQPTMVVGTFQQMKLLGNFPNVTNVLLSTAEPGVLPSSLPGQVAFSSSNPNVATVTSEGVISAVSPGSATLQAVLGTTTNSTSVNVVSTNVTLTHRYSFSETSGTTAADSVGGPSWDGTLNGDAAFSGTGQVIFSGTVGSSVSLPAGIVSNLDAITIETWVTFPTTNAPYATLFALGDQNMIPFDPYQGFGMNYIMMSPHSTTNVVGNFQANFGIGNPGFPNEHDAVVVGTVLDNRANLHIAAVYNPFAGTVTLYTNGVQAAIDNNVAYYLVLGNTVPRPLADTLGADPLNYIGQSLYATDPGIKANVDEFRIYNGALSAAQVAADHALGPNQVMGTSTSVSLSVAKSGANVVLKWPTTSALVTLLSATTLPGPWATVNMGALTTDGGGNYQMTIAAGGSTQFFRLRQ